MKTFRHFKGFWTVIRGYSKMSANEKVPHTKIKEAWSKTGRSSRSVAVPQTLPRRENRSELPALKHYSSTVATIGLRMSSSRHRMLLCSSSFIDVAADVSPLIIPAGKV
jgi:hypothetical protein